MMGQDDKNSKQTKQRECSQHWDSSTEYLLSEMLIAVSKRKNHTYRINHKTLPPKQVGNFKMILSNTFNGYFPVNVYRSSKTGLTVVVGETVGPMVSAYVSFATETSDYDGLPETVRNLVFLGSEDYPYRGVIETIAKNCHVTSFESWAAVNYTCYTYTSASESGFFNMLPIFMDHLLYPTLKKTNYITDVFHIDEFGRDSGRVVKKLEVSECSQEEVMRRHMMSLVYGKTRYRFPPHGNVRNLRTSTTNEKVRRFHTKNYRPENCFIVVIGSQSQTVLKFLEPVERKIFNKGPRGYFHRPWQYAIPPLHLEEHLVSTVKYPSNNEITATVIMAWRGPNVINDYPKIIACDMLLRYLTESADSPLVKEFVNVPKPWATTITYQVEMYIDSLVAVTFHGVPKTKMNYIKDKVDDMLKSLAKTPEVFASEKIGVVLKAIRKETVTALEKNALDFFVSTMINYQIYGKNEYDFEVRVHFLSLLDHVETFPPKFWSTLLNKFLVVRKCVCILGQPSFTELMQIRNEKVDIIKDRVKKHGTEGLSRFKRYVTSAEDDNKEKLPRELFDRLSTWKKPNSYYPFNLYGLEGKSHPRFGFDKLPINIQITDIYTKFITIYALIDTRKVGIELRSYLPLLLESMVQSPIQRNGAIISLEQIFQERKEDLISLKATLGVKPSNLFSCGYPSHFVCIAVTVDFAKYYKGITWLRDTMFHSVFSAERIKTVVKYLLAMAMDKRSDGKATVMQLMNGITHERNSNYWASNMCFQAKFLVDMLACLEDNPEFVLSQLKNVKDVLLDDTVRIHMVVNMEMLATNYYDPAALWQTFLPNNVNVNKYLCKTNHELILLKDKLFESCIILEGDKAFVCLCAPYCLNYSSTDLSALIVCLEYLMQSEGPLYKTISANDGTFEIVACPEHSKIYFLLNGVNNISDVLRSCKATCEECARPGFPWDNNLVTDAINYAVVRMIVPESDIVEVGLNSIVSHLTDRPMDYKKKLVDNILDLTKKELSNVAEKYLGSLFDFAVSRMVIMCEQSNYESVAALFFEWGAPLKVFNTMEDCIKRIY